MTFRLTPQAKADVRAIGDWIAEDNSIAAERLIATFQRRWTALGKHPYSGRPCDHLMPGLRKTVVGNYATYYRPDIDGAIVLRVMHTRRSVTKADFTA